MVFLNDDVFGCAGVCMGVGVCETDKTFTLVVILFRLS